MTTLTPFVSFSRAPMMSARYGFNHLKYCTARRPCNHDEIPCGPRNVRPNTQIDCKPDRLPSMETSLETCTRQQAEWSTGSCHQERGEDGNTYLKRGPGGRYSMPQIRHVLSPSIQRFSCAHYLAYRHLFSAGNDQQEERAGLGGWNSKGKPGHPALVSFVTR